jgi:hypothetical protein
MLTPWLFFIGCTVIFSSLFLMVRRNIIIHAMQRCQMVDAPLTCSSASVLRLRWGIGTRSTKWKVRCRNHEFLSGLPSFCWCLPSPFSVCGLHWIHGPGKGS